MLNSPESFMRPTSLSEDLIKETLAYDVAVLGAGTAGMSAAVSAAEEGVKVVLIEKKRRYTGRGGDNTALNSRLHKQLGIQINVDEVVRKLMEFSGYEADERLIRLWAFNSGKVMDWIIDICTEANVKTWLVIPDRLDKDTLVIDKWPPSEVPQEWDYRKETYIEYPTCHRFGDTPSANQLVLLSALEKKAKQLGVDIKYNTEAIKLERPNGGKVTAVIVKSKDDAYIRIKVNKGLILATGDYANNKAMVEYYLPETMAKLVPLTYGMNGTGHLMACWVGAQMEPKPHPAMIHGFHILGTAPFLMVDRFGKRFVNEDLDLVGFGIQCLEIGGIWVVFDSDWPKYITQLSPRLGGMWRADEKTLLEFAKKVETSSTLLEFAKKVEGGSRLVEFAKKVETGSIMKADTLDELAQKMRNVTLEMDRDAFKATVSRYNELCEMGVDLDFGKRSDRLFPVKTPPFYAHWNRSPLFFATLGGLVVNDNLQPIDKHGKPIQGLYCAGNTVGRRFGLVYPVICPGLSHGMALTYGYIAGKNVCKKF